jgi:hypothetical protein
MGWFQKFTILICSIILYLHIFLHFKVNAFNEFTVLDDVCKDSIMNTIHYKLPFVFDGTTIMPSYDLSQCTNQCTNQCTKFDKFDKSNKNKNIYLKTYESVPMIEPVVKYFTKDTLYKLKKDKRIELHKNLECRNFYLVHKGSINVSCIHPKYKEHLINQSNDSNDKNKKNKIDINDFIDKHSQMLHIDLSANSILFVPNYWFVTIKATDNAIIEKIQYTTILNKINFFVDKYL